jgi:MFS family permease
MLLVARAAQGVAGAVVSAVALSLIMGLFTEPAERAKAMGIYGFVCSAGGSIGVLLGGILTSAFNWHWIFLVNLPIGIAVYACCRALLPDVRGTPVSANVDVTGAVTVTTALMLAVYAIVDGNHAGWTSVQTIGLFAGTSLLLALFLGIEAQVRAPLVPLNLFRSRNLAAANVVGVLWAAAMFAWFFISALYLQRVLGYSALQVGLAFLPANLIMAAFSLGLSAKMVMRFGIRGPLAAGLAMAAAGLALFARAPVDATFVLDVLPAMLLLGLGAGIAFNPMLLAAMSDVAPSDSGLASGVVNTSFMMGGAIGLAVLASLADATTANALRDGATPLTAVNGGYHVAFAVGRIGTDDKREIVVDAVEHGALCQCERPLSVASDCRGLDGASNAVGVVVPIAAPLAVDLHAFEILPHDEVHDAGHRVRTVGRRGAPRQNFDMVD